jgi:hypothetical protein
LKGGDYSDPVLNSGLYQWLDENLDTISPEVPIALSKAEQARARTLSKCHAALPSFTN